MRRPLAALLGLAVAIAAALAPAVVAPAPTPTPAVTAPPAPGAPPCLEPPAGAPRLAPLAALVRPARYIVLHHWGAPPPATAAAAASIFARMGYDGPPYNAMVTASGQLWPGRSEAKASAATWGLNDRSVAICLAADLTHQVATDAAVGGAGLWLRSALKRHPGAKFIQHRDAGRLYGYGTSCAGEASQRDRTARAVWLVACGYKVLEARRRARAEL